MVIQTIKSMKKLLFILLSFVLTQSIFAQDKYFTRTGHVSFYSDAPLEKIEAHNYKAASFLDTKTGDVIFTVLINAFQFKKQLMQDHFNENSMESGKYPKSEFKGKILNWAQVDLKKSGVQNVEVEGDITIHGVTKKIKTKGTIEVKDGKIIAKSSFPITLKDFNITPPVKGKVADVVEVRTDLTYEPYKK